VLIDMSSSFAVQMAEQGQAYQFLMGTLDRFQKSRPGSTDRLLIGQLSENPTALIWDGSTKDFRKQFASPQQFRQLLQQSSNPNGSRVYAGVSAGLESLLEMPSVQSGKTRCAVYVLSDLEDNDPQSKLVERRLIDNLKRYSQVNGVLGLYQVSPHLTSHWRSILTSVPFKPKRFDVVAQRPGKAIALPNFD
jgi:hypothetical protein